MPCIRLIPFLQDDNRNPEAGNPFQCPASGLSHFFDRYNHYTKEDVFCFNALHRAYPISSKDNTVCKKLKHFRFQCPTSGLSHFFGKTLRIYRPNPNIVSMPYIGLIPFLRYDGYGHFSGYDVVSMPYIGLIPFLRVETKTDFTIGYMFQCPTSGLSHFFRMS